MRDPVLVTGGAGFIGSNLVHRCVRDGLRVRVLDDFSTGRESNLAGLRDRIDIIRGDLRDTATVGRSVAGVRTVLHLAALPSVTRSVQDPVSTHAVNVDGTLNLLEAVRAGGEVSRVVVISSSSVYGDTPALPKSEAMRPLPISPYGASKLCGEALVSAYARAFGTSCVALRPFNVYGPRQDPSSEYAAVVPRFVTSLLRGEPGTIYGDGGQTRDFTYVDDMVDAIVLAANWKGGAGEVFNVSGGRRTSVLDLYRAIGEVLGVAIAPVHRPARPGDIRHSHAEITAASAFGYTPHVPLEEGLRRTIDWFRVAKDVKEPHR